MNWSTPTKKTLSEKLYPWLMLGVMIAAGAIIFTGAMLIHDARADSVWTSEEISNGLKTEDFARYVKSGSKTMFFFFVVANPDCSPVEGYEVTLTKPPTHGTVEFEPSKEFATWAKDNVRAKCNSQKIRGTEWIYSSEKGYRGKDEFEITIYDPWGKINQRHFTVDVR